MPQDHPVDPVLLVKAIAHELANPVSGLVGTLELLQLLRAEGGEKRRRYVDLASHTVARLEDAVKDLRHAAIMEPGPVRHLDAAVSEALARAGGRSRLEAEENPFAPVRVGPGLDAFLDRWIEALGPQATLRISRPHRFGLWLQSGPVDPGRSGVLGDVGAAGGRLVDTGSEVAVFFAYPLAGILP